MFNFFVGTHHLLLILTLRIVQIQAQLIEVFFSQTKLSESRDDRIAMFERQDVSVVECAVLSLREMCCEEFIYNTTNKRCIGLHFPDFNCTSNLTATQIHKDIEIYQKGCENGWLEFGSHCYILLETKFPWAEARMECQKMRSYLVETESTVEAEWIGKTFLDKASCGTDPFVCTAWTGCNDRDKEGQYRWDHSKTLLNFSNWLPGEPSLLSPSQALDRDCIDILRSGLWNDRPCSFLNSVVCEKSFIGGFLISKAFDNLAFYLNMLISPIKEIIVIIEKSAYNLMESTY